MAEPIVNPEDIQVRQMTQDVLHQLDPSLNKISNVLIIGVHGLGLEVARKLVLDQVALGSLTLMERDESRLRVAEKLSAELMEQNPFAIVRVEGAVKLSERGYLSKGEFKTVVLTQGLEAVDDDKDDSHANSKWVLEECRRFRIPVIMSETRGCFARIFSDSGSHYRVPGWKATPVQVMIVSITRESEGLVTCKEGHPHCLQPGDFVVFHNVRGMVQLNNPTQPAEVSRLTGPFSFRIGVDTTPFRKYQGGGTISQLQSPKVIHYKPYDESIDDPQYLYSDYEMPEESKRLHLAFHALDQVVSKRGRSLPRSWNLGDANKLVHIGTGIAKKVRRNPQAMPKLDDPTFKMIRMLSYTAKGQLRPLNQAIAGVVAQNVVQISSGRFRPMSQWSYFNGTELLPGAIMGNVNQAGVLRKLDDHWRQQTEALVCEWELYERVVERKVLISNGAVDADMPK